MKFERLPVNPVNELINRRMEELRQAIVDATIIKKPIWRRDPNYAREHFWEGYSEVEAILKAEREAERFERDPGRDHPDAP